MSGGIAAWGTYLPYWRLQRSSIAGTLGSGGGRGSRAVASYDEDTTTLGVEAGRRALAVGPGRGAAQDLFLSTPDPGYLDKTSATTVHAALGLGRASGAYDFAGSSRSAVATLLQALAGAGAGGRGRTTLAVLSDLRTGLAGSAEERDSGDGAAAFVCAPEGEVAEMVGRGSASDEFLDRWRVPGDTDSHVWEERFGEELYVPLAREAFAAALKDAGLSEGDIDHAIVTGLHVRAVKATVSGLGTRDGVLAPDLTSSVGNLGAAHAGVALCDVLERAEPGQVIAVLSLADGADAFILRTTDALPDAQRARAEAGVPSVAEQVAVGRDDLTYATFLTWRGQLRREPPRRPDPERPGAPTVHRSEEWKYGFVASRCLVCGFRHMPPTRACLSCHAIDQMQAERLADVPGTVATFTIDHLAYSMSPPVVGVIVDFDGGGRYRCEMTDVRASELSIGDRVTMTFRRVWTAQGVHNYFWKARPAGGSAAPSGGDPDGERGE
ncbi:MAG TPA: OB-fold domain-containing protein [Acidimicrobiales bacterium]|nr:OB-fold domain-containing protein [Acidimicrobiales bacterium]